MPEIRRLKPEERTEIVMGIINGTYFPLDTKEKMEICGLMIGVSKFFKDWSEEDLKQVGMILGDMRYILPRYVNGLPVFTKFMIIHRDDWKMIVEEYNKKMEMLKQPMEGR